MNDIISHADSALTPVEIRLLNKAQPVIVGQISDGGASLATAKAVLATEPSGLTPVCRQIREVTERLQSMEYALRASGQVALLLIVTDGESTDGNVEEMLQPLEGILQIPFPIITPHHLTYLFYTTTTTTNISCIISGRLAFANHYSHLF